MRHHQYNPGFRFVKDPVDFDKYTDRSLLQYCLGATMYMPGTKDFVKAIVDRKYPGLTSMVMCFEDACPEADVPAAEQNSIHLLGELDRLVKEGRLSYDDIPLITDLAMLESFLTASIQTVFPGAGVIWHKEAVAADAADTVLLVREAEDSAPSRLDAVESRYRIEEEMLDAIRRGSLETAEQKLSDLERQGLNSRSGSTLRDGKNYLIIMNTLCRIAARQAGIHPYDIDQVSRKFSIRIENYANYQDLFHSQLQRAMIRQYCMLIQNHSTSGYSPTMRRILHYIWVHEDESLTLTDLAAAMHLNRNYLCSLFRREVGETLTDYINRRKIQAAVRLMNTGRTDIAAIAEACGIENANYFSRLFKRTEGITATDYIRMLHRPSASSRSSE